MANGGQTSSIGQSSSDASNLNFNPGTGGAANFNYVGTGDSTDRLFTVSSGTLININSSGSGPLSFYQLGRHTVFSGTQPTVLSLGGSYSGSTPNTFAPQIVDSSNSGNPTTLQINGWLLERHRGHEQHLHGRHRAQRRDIAADRCEPVCKTAP